MISKRLGEKRHRIRGRSGSIRMGQQAPGLSTAASPKKSNTGQARDCAKSRAAPTKQQQQKNNSLRHDGVDGYVDLRGKERAYCWKWIQQSKCLNGAERHGCLHARAPNLTRRPRLDCGAALSGRGPRVASGLRCVLYAGNPAGWDQIMLPRQATSGRVYVIVKSKGNFRDH